MGSTVLVRAAAQAWRQAILSASALLPRLRRLSARGRPAVALRAA